MNICYCLLLLLGITFAASIAAQDLLQDSLQATRVSTEYVNRVSDKAGQVNEKLDKKTAKTLQQWQKQEERIKNKLARKDSLKAVAVFGNAKEQYGQLEQKLQSKTSLHHYIPALDTLASSIKFLQQNPQLLSDARDAKEKLGKALSKVKGLENQFQKAEDVKIFLRQRRQYLKEQLNQPGFTKELKKLNKASVYYSAQVSEYRSLLKDHSKAERKALELLSKSKHFNNFMRKNSMLTSLFRLPGDPDNPLPQASLAGLQTRAQITTLIQGQIASGGPNAQQQLQQNIQAAQSQLNQLKEKLLKFPSAGGDLGEAEIPEGFRKNNQRVKSFWQKWEAGINIQSNQSNGIFPLSSDVGLSAGFRPHDNFIIGIGLAGRIGWGKSIRHIDITYSGISVRSFSELKLKGSFHAAIGYEMNYRPEIRDIEQLKNKIAWQSSGLVGLSKVVSLRTKVFKKAKLQLLFDFMSYQQIPRTQPVIFRIGYNF